MSGAEYVGNDFQVTLDINTLLRTDRVFNSSVELQVSASSSGSANFHAPINSTKLALNSCPKGHFNTGEKCTINT